MRDYLKLSIFCFLFIFFPVVSKADIINDIDLLDPNKKTPSPVPSLTPSPPTTKPSITPTSPVPIPPKPVETSETTGSVTPKNPGNEKSRDKKANMAARKDSPIHLASEGTSTYSRNGSTVHLQKNVVITQDDLRLQSDEARVLFKNASDSNVSTVQTVEVVGSVNISRFSKEPSERVTAKSDKAVFVNNEQLVTLDGNARLWKDGHLIRGDRIVYEILTGIIKVDRAQGVVQPEKANK